MTLAAAAPQRPAAGSLTRPTTPLERILVAVAIVLLPLQDAFSFFGLSPEFMWLALVALFVLWARIPAFLTVLFNRVFLAGYGLLFIAFTIESLHLVPSYYDLIRMAEVVFGAALVAALCRDRRVLAAAMYGWVFAGVWVSVYLVAATYGPLRASVASTFFQASVVRADVVVNGILHANLNTLSFITAVGASMSLALAFGAPGPKLRVALMLVFALCLLGTFLPLSRAGVLIASILIGFIVLSRSKGRIKSLLAVLVLVLVVLVTVPNVVFARIQFPTQLQEGRLESRVQLYQASIDHLPEYIWWGVGSGNYWDSWAYNNGFVAGIGVVGSHNAFIQVTIYWGLAGLVAFLSIIWLAFRSLPRMDRSETLAVCIRALALAVLLRLLVTHDLYTKEFALTLGLIVGSREWIWQQATGVLPGNRDRVPELGPA